MKLYKIDLKMSEGLLFILIPSQPAFAISPEGSEDVLQMDNTTDKFMMFLFSAQNLL